MGTLRYIDYFCIGKFLSIYLLFVIFGSWRYVVLLALPCVSLRYIVLTCVTLRSIALPCITLHYLALPCINLRYFALPSGSCSAMRCLALLCVALISYAKASFFFQNIS
jgi:hypothetical protein